MPVYESENFVVVPSLGALVHGWLLVVPREHYISSGALSDSMLTELRHIVDLAFAYTMNEFGRAAIFEHGAVAPSRSVGCGVDHAHVHVAPIGFNLKSCVEPFLPDRLKWVRADFSEMRNAFSAGVDYLYVEQQLGDGHIVTHDEFGSQLFRRAIAAELGIAAQYNWRDYPQLDNVAKTIKKLAVTPLVDDEIAQSV